MKSIPLWIDVMKSQNMVPLLDGVDTTVWSDGWSEFTSYPGFGHYRLLAYLSRYIKGNIIDIGTLTGASAIALSANTDNTVYTFDLEKTTFCNWEDRSLIEVDNSEFRYAKNNRPNIVQKIGNVLDYPSTLLDSELIMLDIDHSGEEEKKIINELYVNNWEGILIMDDTNDPVFESMFRTLLNYGIRIKDLSHVGAGSRGTSALLFGSKYDIIEIKHTYSKEAIEQTPDLKKAFGHLISKEESSRTNV
jgi:hypothetical protein